MEEAATLFRRGKPYVFVDPSYVKVALFKKKAEECKISLFKYKVPILKALRVALKPRFVRLLSTIAGQAPIWRPTRGIPRNSIYLGKRTSV